MEVALRLVEWTAPTLPTRASAPSSVPQNLRRCFVPDLLPEVVPVWMDDGSRLIVATVEGIAIVNDQLEVEHIKHGMKTSVTALAWSSQEKRLYSVYRDSGTIWTGCLDGVSEPCLKFPECYSPGRPYTCRHLTVNPTRPNVVAAAALDGGISDKLVVWVNGVVVFQEQCVFKNQLMSVLQWSPNGQVLGIQTPQSIKFWSLSTYSFIVSNAPKNRQEFGLGWINNVEYAILFDPGPHALFECLPYRVIYNRWCVQVWHGQEVWKTIRACDDFCVGAVCANKLALLCRNNHVLIDPNVSCKDVGELPPPLADMSLFGRGAEVIQATQHQLAPLRPTKMSKVSETKPVWKGACEGQPVVVKESNPNSYYALNELHQAATIPPHPNLARIIGVEKDADLVYEKIRGPMTTVEQQATHMTEFQKVHVALSVMAALEHLHEHGYVHGDIKCDNIVVNKDCSEVQVIDFDRTQPLEHLHPKIGCGLFYRESSVEEEWRVFHEHVLKVLWPQQDRLMDKDPKKTRKNLEEHRIFIARNARVRAWLVHPSGKVEVVELKQHNGVICAPLPYINVYQEKDTGVFWRAIMGSTHPEDGERFDDPDLCDTALYGSILIGYLTNETSFSCRENDDDNFDHPPIIPAKLLDFSPSARFWVSCKDYANDYVIDDPLWLERHNLGLLLGAQLQPRIYVVSDSN